jgi:hypothetical protein
MWNSVALGPIIVIKTVINWRFNIHHFVNLLTRRSYDAGVRLRVLGSCVIPDRYHAIGSVINRRLERYRPGIKLLSKPVNRVGGKAGDHRLWSGPLRKNKNHSRPSFAGAAGFLFWLPVLHGGGRVS